MASRRPEASHSQDCTFLVGTHGTEAAISSDDDMRTSSLMEDIPKPVLSSMLCSVTYIAGIAAKHCRLKVYVHGFKK